MSDFGFKAATTEMDWLNACGNGWQFGEQGIIDAIVSRVDMPRRCMEIGAGDGYSLPVTVERLVKRGWECQLFEIAPHRQQMLRRKFGNRVEVHGEWLPMHGQSDRWGVIIIDIDGRDVEILRDALPLLTPAVVCCEHYDKNAPDYAEVTPCIPPSWLLGKMLANGHTIQACSETLESVGWDFGYTAIGTTRVNTFLVRNDLCERLKRV